METQLILQPLQSLLEVIHLLLFARIPKRFLNASEPALAGLYLRIPEYYEKLISNFLARGGQLLQSPLLLGEWRNILLERGGLGRGMSQSLRQVSKVFCGLLKFVIDGQGAFVVQFDAVYDQLRAKVDDLYDGACKAEGCQRV